LQKETNSIQNTSKSKVQRLQKKTQRQAFLHDGLTFFQETSFRKTEEEKEKARCRK
jgi:hypothetical protein